MMDHIISDHESPIDQTCWNHGFNQHNMLSKHFTGICSNGWFGGLEHCVFFHILGIIIPTDWFFFRGVGQPPTRLVIMNHQLITIINDFHIFQVSPIIHPNYYWSPHNHHDQWLFTQWVAISLNSNYIYIYIYILYSYILITISLIIIIFHHYDHYSPIIHHYAPIITHEFPSHHQAGRAMATSSAATARPAPFRGARRAVKGCESTLWK